MSKRIPPGLSTTFVLHSIVAGAFGLGWLFIPGTVAVIFGIRLIDPLAWRLVGAAAVSAAASSWWASRETEWERVRIVVKMELLWTALEAILYPSAVAFEGYPVSVAVGAILMIAFFLAFAYYWLKEASRPILKPA